MKCKEGKNFCCFSYGSWGICNCPFRVRLKVKFYRAERGGLVSATLTYACSTWDAHSSLHFLVFVQSYNEKSLAMTFIPI